MPRLRGLLIAGTDTGVGKTTLAQGLLRLAHRRQIRLVPYKPVETGCTPSAGDAQKLWEAAALPYLPLEQVCSFRFPDPLAPSVAALLAHTEISREALRAQGRALRKRGDALLVESAGGLLTPYGSNGFTSSSLAELFDIDILLVAANRLGAINHAALALADIRRRHLPLAGLVLVNVAPYSAPDHPHNGTQITALTGISPLGTLRHCPRGNPEDLADAVAADLDLRELLGGRLLSESAPD